ncbi:MAG: HEAT repeat domain-containing protein [Phycisphaerae bacterium]
MNRFVLMLAFSVGVFVAGVTCGGCANTDRSASNLKDRMFGPSASELVAMAFDAEDSDRRREGVTLLSSRDWGLEEPYLKGYAALLASDTDPRVRSAAVRALGKAEDETYLGDVTEALDDPEPQVRRDAAAALDTLTGEEAVAPLCRRAESDASSDVRAACAKALRHYRRPEVVAALIGRLDDPAFAVRYNARQSLVEITGRDLGYDSDAWCEAGAEDLLAGADESRQGRPWWDILNISGEDAQTADEKTDSEE